jgi:hypothetical protein
VSRLLVFSPLCALKYHDQLHLHTSVDSNMAHIDLTRDAAAVIIAPCTTDFMRKLAHGAADDLLSTMCVARPHQSVPLLIAPAMNVEMWSSPATQVGAITLASVWNTFVCIRSHTRTHSHPHLRRRRRRRWMQSQTVFVNHQILTLHSITLASVKHYFAWPLLAKTHSFFFFSPFLSFYLNAAQRGDA